MINSKLIIGILGLIFIGIVWLRMQWGRSRNTNQSKKIIDNLTTGKHAIESYADALNIMIVSKPIPQLIDIQKIKQNLRSLSNKKILNKFTIQYGDANAWGKGIVIGEGLVKDIVNDRQIDVFYPCWIYIDMDETSISFKSTFPENKDHHYLLEDMSVEIYNQCIKNQNG
jgi:hypothetical protein